MNQLDRSERAAILRALVEGSSIRATARMTGNSRNTVTKLILDMAAVCDAYSDQHLRSLESKRLQIDEAWAFCYCKARQVSRAKGIPDEERGQFGRGDCWTFAALDADSKLVASWLVGPRDGGTATAFCEDLAGRLATRVQLTSDALKAYLEGIEAAFGADIDFAQLQKHYASVRVEGTQRYSPPECTGVSCRIIVGDPDPAHVSTSYIERLNLSLRMASRRYTRLTNAFSKKLENHVAATCLFFFHYNFVRGHMTLKGKTPAQAAGVAGRRWSIEDMASLLEGRNPES